MRQIVNTVTIVEPIMDAVDVDVNCQMRGKLPIPVRINRSKRTGLIVAFHNGTAIVLFDDGKIEWCNIERLRSAYSLD